MPLGASLTVTPTENFQIVAELEPTTQHLVIQDTSNPRDVRFLTVPQGADAGTPMDAATVVQSSGGTPFTGVVVQHTAVLFAVSATAPMTTVTYSVPNTITGQLITGLAPNGTYTVTMQGLGGNTQVTVAPGSGYQADNSGVLGLGAWAPPPQFLIYLPSVER